MSRIKLEAKNTTEQRILDYLTENASDVLAERINSGFKTLGGAMDYAQSLAKKMSKGLQAVCIDDATVFGWIVHYFEEDSIVEAKKAATVRTPGNATPNPVAKPTAKAKAVEQPSMLDALFGG